MGCSTLQTNNFDNMYNSYLSRKPTTDDAFIRLSIKSGLVPTYNSMSRRDCIGRFSYRENNGVLLIVFIEPFSGKDHVSLWSIVIIKESCNFGGFRWWFICPITGKKCRNIYIYNSFIGSQQGLGLKYLSQLETPLQRSHKYLFDFIDDKFFELRESIKYPYRNGIKTRKEQKRTKVFQSVRYNFPNLWI